MGPGRGCLVNFHFLEASRWGENFWGGVGGSQGQKTPLLSETPPGLPLLHLVWHPLSQVLCNAYQRNLHAFVQCKVSLVRFLGSVIYRHVPEFPGKMEHLLRHIDQQNAAAAQRRAYFIRAFLAYAVFIVVLLGYAQRHVCSRQPATTVQAPSLALPISVAQGVRLIPPPLSAAPPHKSYATGSWDVAQAENWEAAERIAHPNRAAAEIQRRKTLSLHTDNVYGEHWDAGYYIAPGVNIMAVLLFATFLVPPAGLLLAWASHGSLWGTMCTY